MRELMAIGADALTQRMWWNGDPQPERCAYVRFGQLADGGWFLQYTANGKTIGFDHREDGLAVAQHLALGWAAVPTSFDVLRTRK